MNINDLYDSILLTKNLATDNYHARNRIIDRLNATVVVNPASKAPYIAGECSHYFPKYEGDNYEKVGEVVLYCRCSPTVKGGTHYTFSLNGKRVSYANLAKEMILLGVLR